MSYKIKVQGVSKAFQVISKKRNKILSLFSGATSRNVRPFYALKDISFEVKAGDSVGILGLNGSGKSTLTDLLAGVTQPTSGEIYVKGTPSLIAIGAGLEQELTGVENIRYKCLMHGMTNKEIDRLFNDIVEYSELGDFIHQPLRTYSSGMKSKLGFSIAIHTDPDILIVDEALSVGDKTFSNKCIVSLNKFQKQGKTILFVTHAPGMLKRMCNKGMWLHFGELKALGDIDSVSEEYEEFITGYNRLNKDEQFEYREKMSARQYGDMETVGKTKEDMSLRTIVTSFSLFLFTIFIILYHTWVVI